MRRTSLTEARGRKPQTLNEGMQLASTRWARQTRLVTEAYKRTHKGKAPSENILSTTAIMLENTRNMMNRLDETTKQVNLGNFVDYGFGIITAVMPALVANELVSVQPLKARSGEIFYLNYTFGSNKGPVTAGQSAISPFTGAANQVDYSGEDVPSEYLGETTQATSNYEAQLSYGPVLPGTVEINIGPSVIADNGLGSFVVKSGSVALNTAQSNIDYVSGHVILAFSTPVAANTSLAARYRFSYGNQDVGASIPELNVDLGSTTISTVTRSLRARWIFDSAFELQQVHGINVDEEISTALAAEIRHEIDSEILQDLQNQAAAGDQIFTWSKTAPAGVAYVDHKDTLIDTIIRMSNAIFQDTQRADGNFLVCGMNVASLIESIPGRFVADGDSLKAGPHIIGTLDNRWKVVKNPYYGANDFIVGHRGESYLESGYVYAPFLPLYTTPTIMLDDMINRKAIRTIYGKKCLNPKFYAKGTITD